MLLFYSDEATGAAGSDEASGASDEAAGAASSPLERGVGTLASPLGGMGALAPPYCVTKYPSGFVRSHCLMNGSALSAVGTLRVPTPLSHGEDSVFTRSPGVSHVIVSVAPAMTPRTRSNVGTLRVPTPLSHGEDLYLHNLSWERGVG